MKKLKNVITSFILLSTGSFLLQRYCMPKKQNMELPSQNPPTETAKPVQAAEPKPTESPSKTQEQGYKIQEYDGNIAVFEKGQQKPFRKTDIAVKNLPEADRTNLKNGIEVKTNEELQSLLEDYLS